MCGLKTDIGFFVFWYAIIRYGYRWSILLSMVAMQR